MGVVSWRGPSFLKILFKFQSYLLLNVSYLMYIFTEGVILQAPNSVFEGEPLHLRCHSDSGDDHENQNITFFKNGKVIQTSDQNFNFYVSRVTVDITGRYHCEKKLDFTSDQIQSEETVIDVKGKSFLKSGISIDGIKIAQRG